MMKGQYKLLQELDQRCTGSARGRPVSGWLPGGPLNSRHGPPTAEASTRTKIWLAYTDHGDRSDRFRTIKRPLSRPNLVVRGQLREVRLIVLADERL